ncbi:hypothetical protein THAOC_15013 [Thalassiosira oceanica]|uniref:Uncharacterized protein n=1 Tax=Thalassiosira oceanica TaxID=159749 RepID=K0SH23_THAOC|nr:hypothetical protein THAOC_15013 [Thalassiosira oceanica]|eukprot:EJK64269.1 hypothetical protein THAOC_15013 [Thalassiosira oceanica]
MAVTIASRVAMEETLSQGAKAETQEATVIMCNNRSMFPGELKLDRSAVETAYGVGVSRYTDTIRITRRATDSMLTWDHGKVRRKFTHGTPHLPELALNTGKGYFKAFSVLGLENGEEEEEDDMTREDRDTKSAEQEIVF